MHCLLVGSNFWGLNRCTRIGGTSRTGLYRSVLVRLSSDFGLSKKQGNLFIVIGISQ